MLVLLTGVRTTIHSPHHTVTTTTQMKDYFPWGADIFWLEKNLRIRPTVRQKTKKTLTSDNSSDNLITSFFSHLISPPRIKTIPWCSGYCVMIGVVRKIVQTLVSNTTENHYNIVVLQPLLAY